jgi:hypothetical protein
VEESPSQPVAPPTEEKRTERIAPPPLDELNPDLSKIPDTLEYDPELDAGSSPLPPGSDSQFAEGEGDSPSTPQDPERQLGEAIDEVVPLDPHRHWVSPVFGFLTAGGLTTRGMFTGGGVRYGYTVAKMVFLKRARLQDSFTPEAGIYVYKALFNISASASPPAYTVLPLSLSLRYNLTFSSQFTFFAQLGAMMNIVTSAINADSTLTSNFQALIPVFGVGGFYTIGPNWLMRFDMGYDFIGAGIVLKF